MREVLCTWNVELYDMAFHRLYAEYQQLLSRLFSDNLQGPSRLLTYLENSDREKRQLKHLISTIEFSIYSLNSVAEGTVQEHQSEAETQIEWKRLPATTGTLFENICRAVNVESVHLYLKLTIDITNMLEANRTGYHISSEIQNLKKLLDRHQDAVATFHTGDVPDMVGWRLEKAQSDSDRTVKPRREKRKHEKALGLYKVKSVNVNDLQRNTGEWRGNIKLILRYPNDPDTYAGTGWLVDEYTIATNGHNAFDTEGYLISVEVLFAPELSRMGGSSTRHGTHVVVHWGWYNSFLPCHDLAFIRLNSPQPHTKSIEYECTPRDLRGKEVTLIGYPGVRAQLPGNGLRMYWASCNMAYNFDATSNMLQYSLDTYKGNSGSPVFHGGSAIGVHQGWTEVQAYADPHGEQLSEVNCAVKIDEGANDFDRFREILHYVATGKPTNPITLTIASMPEKKGLLRYVASQ